MVILSYGKIVDYIIIKKIIIHFLIHHRKALLNGAYYTLF